MTTETAPVHLPPDPNDVEHDATANIAAHLPPAPGRQPVWADVWNPVTNEWAPSNEQHSTWGVAEPTHYDSADATPETQSYGVDERGSSTPDARANLLDAVRSGGPPATVPTHIVQHVITTQEEPSSHIRTRTVRVQGTEPTVLLEQNENRIRAILKVITTSGQVLIGPVHQGQQVRNTATATAPLAQWVQSAGDPHLVVESSEGCEALASNTGVTLFSDVSIWEEMKGAGDSPGLSG